DQTIANKLNWDQNFLIPKYGNQDQITYSFKDSVDFRIHCQLISKKFALSEKEEIMIRTNRYEKFEKTKWSYVRKSTKKEESNDGTNSEGEIPMTLRTF